MVFQTILLLVVLALIAFYAFEGLLNALVMAVCTLLSVLLAANYFEPLAAAMPTGVARFADSFAWAILFAVPLFGLRFAADKLLGGMVHFPYWVDRIGGGAVGLFNGLVIAGVIALCLLLLPFGAATMGFAALPDTASPGVQPAVASAWIPADKFVVGLIRTLSGASMASPGAQPFARIHPDYLLEVAGSGRRATGNHQPVSNAALKEVRATPPGQFKSVNALAVGGWMPNTAPQLADKSFDEPKRMGVKFLKVTIAPVQSPDEEGYFLAPGQAQLTVRQVDESGKVVSPGQTRLLLPQWIIQPGGKPQVPPEPFRLDQTWWAKDAENMPKSVVSLVYAVPRDFGPWFLTVKRNTRVELAMPGGEQIVTAAGDGPGGEQAGITVTWRMDAGWRKRVSPALPANLLSAKPLTTAPDTLAQVNVKDTTIGLSHGKLAQAKLMGNVSVLRTIAGGKDVKEFAVPDGWKLVQLEGKLITALKDEEWAKVAAATVAIAGPGERMTGALAGLALKTRGSDWLLCYNARLEGDRFSGIGPASLPPSSPTEQILLLIVVPADTRLFNLDLGGGEQIQVDLSAGK